MRNAFAQEVTALAGNDPRIVMMMGDIGNRLFDSFKASHPDRFFNCGVAEANMISLAAGMASSGLRPICYTIAPFITYRAIEQIRLDLCYHQQPVIFVGTGAGLSYASLGATHHSLEDIGMLRTLPNLTLLCPGDANELRACLRAALEIPGPVYLRIGKKGEPKVHSNIPDLTIGRSLRMRSGGEVCLLAVGNMLPVALAVADSLAKAGHETGVFSVHTVKPFDHATVTAAFASGRLVATLEEHSRLGGFGSMVAEWMADHPEPAHGTRLLRFGTPDEFLHVAGEQEFAREHFCIDETAITRQILTELGNPPSE